jgi:2-polyprenyl-3-methyl-5-hydroxy-6-metoxy-1,4-benzoquinol methylase
MEAWNEAWATAEGRKEWLEPDPFVVELLPTLQAANIQRGLDLGFGVGRHTVLLAGHGLTLAGLDAAANGLDYANAWAAQEGLSLDLQTGDMAQLP